MPLIDNYLGSKLPKSVIRALKLRIDEAIIKDKKVMDKMRLAHMRRVYYNQ